MTADRIALAYFVYLAIAAWLVPRTSWRRRAGVSALATVIALLAYVAAVHQPLAVADASRGVAEAPPAWRALAQGSLPLVWLVLGYWLPAGLWRGPMPRVEAWLLTSDRWLPRAQRHRRGDADARAPIAITGEPAHPIFEAAYLLVHPIVPAAALVLWLAGHEAHLDRFWSAVLLAGYACYGTLPWLQTRPPRLLDAAPATASATPAVGAGLAADPHDPATPLLRRLNLRLLERVSIRANTFPSGHAAVAMLVALCVTTVLPTIGALFLILAALIAAATVVGRYHYTADTLLGLIVALLAWTFVFLRGS